MIGPTMKAFETQVNLNLLDDIISFILKSAAITVQQKRSVRERCIFPSQNSTAAKFQDRYGFMYLGELLERYEERFGMTPPEQRAIALALGYTRNVVTKEMFMGSQRADFLRAVERNAPGDVYLTGALYLIHEGESGALAYEKQLTERQYAHTEELIFAWSLFQNSEQAFTAFKDQLVRLLGVQRTIPVMENSGIFEWAVSRLFPLKNLLKSKNMATLRVLPALATSFVRKESKPYASLLEAGYTPVEIAYANVAAMDDQWIPEKLHRKTLLSEKLIVNLFDTVLSCEQALPERVYTQLTDLYTRYAHFEVKYNEAWRLSDAIDKTICIQCPETMTWFLRHESVWSPLVQSFDITDPKWDSLSSSLRSDVYQRLFENSLTDEMDHAAIQSRIDRYDTLTQTGYVDSYWAAYGGQCFPLMVKKGFFDLWEAFQSCLDSEGNVSNTSMLGHIASYLDRITTIQAFQFLKKFMPKYGCGGLDRYIKTYHRGFSCNLWQMQGHPGYRVKLSLQRGFLKDNPGDQLLLLHWAEETVLMDQPRHYIPFIQALLTDDYAANLIPFAERRKLFDLLLSQSELSTYDADQLKLIYLTPEEQQADQEAAEEQKRARERQAREDEVNGFRDEYAKKTDGTFYSIWEFMDGYHYYEKRMVIAVGVAQEQFAKHLEQTGYVARKTDIPYFLRACAYLVQYGAMDWAEAQTHISRMKEVENDDPSEDPTD